MVAHTACRPHSKYGQPNTASQIRPAKYGRPARRQGWERPRLLTLGSTNLKRSASTATRPQVVVACARAGRAGEDFTDPGTPRHDAGRRCTARLACTRQLLSPLWYSWPQSPPGPHPRVLRRQGQLQGSIFGGGVRPVQPRQPAFWRTSRPRKSVPPTRGTRP
jgi:hypothetical protein